MAARTVVLLRLTFVTKCGIAMPHRRASASQRNILWYHPSEDERKAEFIFIVYTYSSTSSSFLKQFISSSVSASAPALQSRERFAFFFSADISMRSSRSESVRCVRTIEWNETERKPQGRFPYERFVHLFDITFVSMLECCCCCLLFCCFVLLNRCLARPFGAKRREPSCDDIRLCVTFESMMIVDSRWNS